MTENSFDTENYKITQDTWGEIGKIKGPQNFFWFIGSFIDSPSLAKRDDFEVKYWEFKKGEEYKHKPKFQVLCTEYNFIIEGKIMGKVGDKKGIVLERGDYIVIRPGEIVNLQQVIIEDVKGITIKTPSRHGDTIKNETIEKLLNFEK